MNIATLIERAGQRWPEVDAVIDDATGLRVPFAGLAARVFGVARRLAAEPGLQPGARVALVGDTTVDYLAADYGTMSAGLVRVSLDPSLSLEEMAAQVADAGAAALLFTAEHAATAQALQQRLPAAAPRLLPVEGLDAAHPQPPAWTIPARCPADALAALNYTGGTTGAPKAVMHTHGSFAAALQNIAMARGAAGPLMLNVRPLWPIASLALLAHLVQGGTVVLGGHFDPRRFVELARAYRPTCTSLVPTHLVRLLRDAAPRPEDLASLRSVDVGAAAVAPDLFRQAAQAFGPSLCAIYGLTEAPWTCYRAAAGVPRILADPEGTRGWVGAATFGSEFMIADPDGRPLPAGETGEVLIRGAHLMQGYWQRAELTAEVLRDGWFHTGDLGRVDGGGNLYIQGRAKDLIRTGGKSVQPAEVERVLCEHPSIREASVIGIDDPEWGERVAAAVVLNAGHPLDAAALAAFCRERLSSYKLPRHFHAMEALPRSHYGKVQRAKVKEAILAARA
ncbi:AMP-binding protein [Pigmentiphaga soli]|uniref:AMP-binding protein n=1 Tax=Pigmentiphaga soli TaxID=1007095 RepID=A0ABP8GCG6_9BURK